MTVNKQTTFAKEPIKISNLLQFITKAESMYKSFLIGLNVRVTSHFITGLALPVALPA
jgi:hypothetical protein